MRPVHFHVEEPSMEAFLSDLLPRIAEPGLDWKVIDHRSKWQLLREVPNRLAGYANCPAEWRPKSLILVDRDDDDCLSLKAQLEAACARVGLATPATAANAVSIDVVNRIVIEELEAWYFGDVPALVQAWPGIPDTLGNRARYRDPDAILGGTHEALLRVLQRAGYHKGAERLPKIEAARRMGALIDPQRNRSHSFHTFLTGFEKLVATA